MKFNLNLDSINYIKIVYKDINDKTCCTKAAIKRMGEREIFACAKFKDGLILKTPQEILLSFICDNGLYRTNTQLNYVENQEPYAFFSMQTPSGIEYQQNREYFRVRMSEDVILRYDNQIAPCKMHDISANGIALVLEKNIGKPKEIVIDVLFSPTPIKAKAKLIRIDEEDGVLKGSFKFCNLSQNDIDIISQKCIQKQLEYKRNAIK